MRVVDALTQRGVEDRLAGLDDDLGFGGPDGDGVAHRRVRNGRRNRGAAGARIILNLLFDTQTIQGRAEHRPREAAIAAKSDGLDQARLDALLGYALRRARLRASAGVEASVGAAGGPTPGRLGALLLIEANPGLTQTALGRALGIDRSSVVPLVARLMREGLIRRDAHADRRAHALALAADGVALLARLRPALAAHEKRIARALRPVERRQLMRLLARVAPAG